MIDHHVALFAGYGAVIVGRLALHRAIGKPEPAPRAEFERPWREVGYAFIAAVLVIGVGQLWQNGVRLPETNPVFSALNQLFIFLPIVLLLVVRRQHPATAWFPLSRVHWRLALGGALAAIALQAFDLAAPESLGLGSRLQHTFRFENLDELTQVGLEDLSIGVLLVRLGAALRREWVVAGLVAALFASGHIPAMVHGEAALGDFALLLGDVALGLGVCRTVQVTRDLWWFWPVHFALDMTQFQAA